MSPDTLPFFVNFDPVALQLGPLAIRWYGLMYLLSFAAFWWLGSVRARQDGSGWTSEQVNDFLFYGALGVILGGRIGYVLFYDFANVIAEPLRALRIWEGGMSFHGGMLGVGAAVWWYARRTGRKFFDVTDFIIPMVPIGLALGRVGNFIGGELWGRLSDAPWAVIFPNAIMHDGWQSTALYQQYLTGELNHLTRHPSQLYQAALEGVLLFIVVWWYSSKPRPRMAVTGLFLIGYGVARLLVEQFRQPDAHLNFIAFDWLTMGQALSIPMVLAGVVMMVVAYRRQGE
ncbi:MAG: prolipoprotein diacylglyceryl transferase [Lysobacteraceae bacterium]|nr:MAG: prolipoprotein diacylglyceryl transferase [Xanthomonadaceae bacterium]